MAYCTQAEIEERYGPEALVRYADRDEDGEPDSDVITRAITDADGVIDSYLQVKFVVPVPPPLPPVLVAYAITLAWCNLLRGARSMHEDDRKDCEAALQWLKDLAAGKVQIGLTPKPAASASAPGVRYEVDDREFGRDKPLG